MNRQTTLLTAAGAPKAQDPGDSVGWNLLQPADVIGDFSLQLLDLIERAFRENRKVVRILGQNVGAVRLQNALHPTHLFNGLLKLFGGFDHKRILKMPLRRARSRRTCWKNAMASSNSDVLSRTATISNPNRFCTRFFDTTLYAPGRRSAVRSWSRATTTMRSMSLGSGVAVTKLPSTIISRTICE